VAQTIFLAISISMNRFFNICLFFKALFIFYLICPLFLYSQEEKHAFHLLITAGVVPSQVHGDAYSGFHKLGFMGGLGVETSLTETEKMNFSLVFLQKGAQKNPNLTKGDVSAYYLNLNYLEAPLLFSYIHKKYLLELGVAASYLINYYEADHQMVYTGVYPFEKFDYSVKVGLGRQLNEKWMIHFRSSNSFITTRPNRIKQAVYYNNIIARTFNKGYYNNILELTLSYKIKGR
jgi:hypothetical protein